MFLKHFVLETSDVILDIIVILSANFLVTYYISHHNNRQCKEDFQIMCGNAWTLSRLTQFSRDFFHHKDDNTALKDLQSNHLTVLDAFSRDQNKMYGQMKPLCANYTFYTEVEHWRMFLNKFLYNQFGCICILVAACPWFIFNSTEVSRLQLYAGESHYG